MSRRKNVLMVTTGILIGILMAGTAAHAAEAPPIRVSSYKGAVLEVGERSGLVIGPSGAAYTVTSSDPDTVAVEQVMSCWVAVAKSEGSVEITASNQAGETGALTLTVGPDAPQAPTTGDSPDQREVSDVRLELVRLVNETRRENGVAELTVNEALMEMCIRDRLCGAGRGDQTCLRISAGGNNLLSAVWGPSGAGGPQGFLQRPTVRQ